MPSLHSSMSAYKIRRIFFGMAHFFPTCNDSFRTSSNRCAITEEGMANYWNHNLEVHIMLSTDIIRLLHHNIIHAS